MLLSAGALVAGVRASDGDLPPVGYSRFDALVGTAPVPFPFSRLVAQINAQMQPDVGGLPPLKITLVPLGRSLQRDAGAPDFFRFPRVVAAADGLSRPGVAPLKDRLFLGYHEKANVLEVISYNDRAGRFEFQVVQGYSAGETPRVYYARRDLCLACHQNAAPLFARPLWDETPANPAIADRLRASGRDFYGVKLTGTDIAYFIDASSDRANLFSVWQRLWRQGCGDSDGGDRCRRDAFAAALDYARFRTLPPPHALRTLQRNWSSQWPDGLAIPNADIPNRNPLSRLPNPAADPLLLRPPLAVWHAPDITAFVVGLADMLDTGAVTRLGDRNLTRPLERLRVGGHFAARAYSPALMDALLETIDLRSPIRTVAVAVAPPRLASAPSPRGSQRLFHQHCGSCHDTGLSHPPNFLHGSADRVEARLNQCAARIFVRLSAAALPEPARRVSPMPPAAALEKAGLSPAHWLSTRDYAALRHSAATRLKAGQPERLLRQAYSSLPPCAETGAYTRLQP